MTNPALTTFHPRHQGLGFHLVFAAAFILLAAATPSLGLVVVVDVTTDAEPAVGSCSAAAGDCPLRRAIELAIAGDEIHFDPAIFGTPQTIQLVSELLVERAIRITGPGRELLTLRGTGADRVMRLDVTGTFYMTDLTLTNGFAGTSAGSQFGGGVLLEGGNAEMNGLALVGSTVDHASGGGGNLAMTGGSLRLTNSLIASGVARGGAVGGGFYASGSGTAGLVINGVFTGNESFAQGAAVANDGAFVVLLQSTLTQNTATSQGGAVYSRLGTTSLEFCTLAFNDSVSSITDAREIYVDAGGVFLNHTLIAAPSTTARGIPITVCRDDSTQQGQGIISNGYNLSNRPCGLTNPTDLPQQAVGLATLEARWDTFFYRLQPTSPAIDAGQANCSTTFYNLDLDQRNLPRRLDADGDGTGQCDIGATEVQAIFVDGFESGDTARWM